MKITPANNTLLRLVALATLMATSLGFLQQNARKPAFTSHLNMFGKMFEEEGMLGKGITVGKVQVALMSSRSSDSIYALLERKAAKAGNSPQDLARLANDVGLTLMRKSDDWIAACSSSKWFKGDDAGKAESYFNDLSTSEAVKFEKEYIPDGSSDENADRMTTVVVSLVLEIQGDSTKFDGAGFSIAGTKEVLASIASDCLVDDGCCVNAVEVFWTPSDNKEILTKLDMIVDFPELIDV